MPTAHRNLATGRLSEVHRGQCPPAPEGCDVVRLARMPEGRGPWTYDPATELAVAAAPTRREEVEQTPLPGDTQGNLVIVVSALAARLLELRTEGEDVQRAVAALRDQADKLKPSDDGANLPRTES